MYRQLLGPRWIAAHLAIIVIAGLFVFLGFWQLDRLDQRRVHKSRIESRSRMPAIDLEQVLDSSSWSSGQNERGAYRRARVKGVFDTDREVLLEGRSNLGRPGSHLLTPLVTPGGRAVIVDRGWVPMALDRPPVAQARPPEGVVAAEGFLLPEEPRSRFGPQDPPPGPVRRLHRTDVKRLANQLPYPVFPLVLKLETQKPPNQGSLPRITPLREPEEGPHLSYALQWFSFAALGLITYGAFLRRQAGGRSADRKQPAIPEAAAPG